MTATRIITTVLCAVLVQCLALPTEVLQNPQALSPVRQEVAPVAAVDDAKREQRSPQFGFLNEEFGDGEVEFDDERRFKHHRKHHHHKPEGCGGYPCGEYPGFGPPAYPSQPVVYPPPPPAYPPPGSYPPPPGAYPPLPVGGGGGGGSFATASAGSESSGAGGGQSQANAQSASFNFGPYSASFSIAESSSGSQRF